jgi:hypothetical protein
VNGSLQKPQQLRLNKKDVTGKIRHPSKKQLDIYPFQSQYIQYISKKEMHCMTEKQAEAEIRYRLAKFLLFRLQEENLLTTEESEKTRQALCKKYKPFTYSLEADEPWMNGK